MEWENQLIQELQWSNKISNKASKELVVSSDLRFDDLRLRLLFVSQMPA